jgi:hypothetical protein
MSFTRFHDDPVRVQKRLEESTYEGRYQLDRPGPGISMPFSEDPHQRLQQWGANLRNNTINLESDLRGMTRKTNRDHISNNNYLIHSVRTEPLATYGTQNPFTDESRLSDPAWMYRDLEQSKWEEPLLDPQRNVEVPFVHNVQTRILEKDMYRPS